MRGLGMDWRPGWTQPLHTETYSRHNPLNTPPQEPTRSLAGGAVPGTWWVGGDRSLDGQVARRQAGWHVVYGKPASRASGWEPPATLIPFSVCHAVLLAGCALSSEVTNAWCGCVTSTSNWLGSSICHRHCLVSFPFPASHRKMVNSLDKRIILVSSK